MYSTFHGLEIGKRAILSQQTALSTTGQNIANANTKGYTRQESVLSSSIPLASPSPNNGTIPMQMGTGVEVSEFRRIRENYLDSQFRNEQQQAGFLEAKADSLSQLEDVFNELSGTGLSTSLNNFWQGLQELAKQPESLSARVIVTANGKDLADNLNQLYSGIADAEKSMEEQLQAKEAEINSAASEIASLNLQISKSIGSGQQPNDLYDRRDSLLDNLSKLVDIDVRQGDNGRVNVLVGGEKLVNGNNASEVSIDPDKGGLLVSDRLVSLTGGEIQGLLETHGYTDTNGKTVGRIPELRTNLDLLATTIAEGLNEIHASDEARNLDDIRARSTDPNAALDQLKFFVDKDDHTQPPKNAGSMIVNPELLDNPSKVAAATSDNFGDGSNALKMSDLFTGKLNIGDTNTTIGDFYQTVIGQLATEVQSAEQSSNDADMMVTMVDNQRQSVSGVSIDEEMTNMIRYQQAYNAAARYVSAVNDLLDTLINGMK
ncbi:flagellar hook-associated protein FlgK [Neobacillus sp. Marseille-QA0830]